MASFLGLDWDNNQLHLVAATTGRGGVRVERAVVWQDDFTPAPARAEAVGQRLRDYLRAAGVAPAPALITVGRDRLILKEIRYPAVPPSEEAAVVRFQASKEMAESGEGVVIDYAPRGAPAANGEKTAFAFAVRRDVPAFLQAVCRAAGLKLLSITPRGYGVASCLKRSAGTAENVASVLTLSGSWADFSVVRGESLLFSRSLPANGNLAAEVRRNLAVYGGQASAAGDKVQALYVAAGGERAGLVDELRQALSLPVHALDPFDRDAGLEAPADRGGFTGAVGLVAAWAAHRKAPINFVQPKEPVKQTDPQTKRTVQFAGLGALILAGLVFICFQILADRSARLDELRAQDVDYESRLLALGPDARQIEALKEWNAANIPWLDELYDVTAHFPYHEGFFLTDFTGLIKSQPLARHAKVKVKDRYAGLLSLTGAVRPRDDDLVGELKTALTDPDHRAEIKQHGVGVGGAKKDAKTFAIRVEVVRQPSAKHAVRFVPPPRRGSDPLNGPEGFGFDGEELP